MFDKIDAVIFDMDGTLIDSMWIWAKIDGLYLEKFGLNIPKNLTEDIEGMSFTETAQYFKDRFGIKEDIELIKKEWNDMAYEYYQSIIPLKDEALTFLKLLKSQNIKMGIATSNSREMVDLISKRFGLGDYIEAISTSCEVNKGKPNPDIYLKVAEDLGVLPERCLIFEDVPNGILAGKNAGMKTCGIFDETSKHLEEKMKLLADYFIDDYKELMKWIEDEDDHEWIFANK